MPIRVVLADDHVLIRAGLRALLHSLPNVQVVGEAGDGHEAVAVVEKIQPDVVIMDIAMATLNGLDEPARRQPCARPRRPPPGSTRWW